MEALLRSKKGCAAILACLLGVYGTDKGWTFEQILLVTGPITAYIGVEGAVDHRRAKTAAQPVATGKPS